MLVLSRTETQEIVVELEGGELVVVTVVEIGRGKVRLGVTAEKNRPVHRREVYEAIKRERKGT